MSSFINRLYIVTGGAQGIGRCIAEHLINLQATVVVADQDSEAGEEMTRRLNTDAKFLFIRTDVGCEESVQNCIQKILHRFDSIDGLINNAGIAHPKRVHLTELSLAQWDAIIRTNLTGAFLMSKHAAPHLKKSKGAIVNIASTRALQSEPDTEPYSASKGGILALTHASAISLGPNVRVNAISPGWIDVSGSQKSGRNSPQKLTHLDHSQHPAGRVGKPQDIAYLTAFLLSSKAEFITGQEFIADGGMTKKMIYVSD